MSKKTGTIVVASVAALATAAVVLPNANAGTSAPDPLELNLTRATQIGQSLTSELGRDSAGWYYDDASDRLVMNVLNEDDAKQARAEGAEVRVVEHSTEELKAAAQELSKSPVAGTAWSIDPKTNKLSVIVDDTVKGAAWAELSQQTKALGERVSVKKVSGQFKPFAEGGDAIFGEKGRCSLGFNVTKDGKPGFLTAGHCTMAGNEWATEQGGKPVAKITESSWDGDDYALAMYNDPKAKAPSSVDLGNGDEQTISGAADAVVGMSVKRMGSTTGLHDGKVTGLDMTVNYQGGYTVSGLIETDVCSERGDSGGAMFSDDKAVGLTSGGGGDCQSGGSTFFQPVTEALKAVGAQIGKGDPGDGGDPGDDCGGKPEKPGKPEEPGKPGDGGQPSEPGKPGDSGGPGDQPGAPGEGGDEPGEPAA
ncbi:alpha-lytic protease prodomain-containing protein [Streptomyces sp. NPDC002659]|uniref:alpha-lytic protease prodomain-containing protein n=1 Tax=Streptomyces sp. NPDC002659 TaxID=3364656 RepID=UPI0036BE16F1